MLVCFACAASAQDASQRDRTVNRLNNDLRSLSAVTVDAGCAQLPRNQIVEQCLPFVRVLDDLARVTAGQKSPKLQTTTIALAMNLVNLLQGRNVDSRAVYLLSGSLIDALASANYSITKGTPASTSPEFRESLLRMYAAFYAMGVDHKDAELLISRFARDAEGKSNPDFIAPSERF